MWFIPVFVLAWKALSNADKRIYRTKARKERQTFVRPVIIHVLLKMINVDKRQYKMTHNITPSVVNETYSYIDTRIIRIYSS